jgi:hypothetical protein
MRSWACRAGSVPRSQVSERRRRPCLYRRPSTICPLGTESRDGYTRDSLRHWNAGNNPTYGCHTRAEVLLDEAVEAPAVGPNCALTGGVWWSYYNGVRVTSPPGWISTTWCPEQRRGTAERRPGARSAVRRTPTTRARRRPGSRSPPAPITARPTRPFQWLPPAAKVHCGAVRVRETGCGTM